MPLIPDYWIKLEVFSLSEIFISEFHYKKILDSRFLKVKKTIFLNKFLFFKFNIRRCNNNFFDSKKKGIKIADDISMCCYLILAINLLTFLRLLITRLLNHWLIILKYGKGKILIGLYILIVNQFNEANIALIILGLAYIIANMAYLALVNLGFPNLALAYLALVL